MRSHDPAPTEWNASLTGDYLWSNVNFGEAITEAMTPLTWSVLRFTLDDWVFVPGHPLGGQHRRPALSQHQRLRDGIPRHGAG